MDRGDASPCRGCPQLVDEPADRHWRIYAAGSVLLEQGVLASDVLRVRTGAVLLTSVDGDGNEQLCCLRGPGACLNLPSMQGRPSAFRAQALVGSEICHLPTSTLNEALRDGGARAEAVLALAIMDSQTWAKDLALLSHPRSADRLAALLLSVGRLGIDADEIPRHLVARILHIRPETLSRLAQEFRNRGALGEGLRVEDPSLLRGRLHD